MGVYKYRLLGQWMKISPGNKSYNKYVLPANRLKKLPTAFNKPARILFERTKLMIKNYGEDNLFWKSFQRAFITKKPSNWWWNLIPFSGLSPLVSPLPVSLQLSAVKAFPLHDFCVSIQRIRLPEKRPFFVRPASFFNRFRSSGKGCGGKTKKITQRSNRVLESKPNTLSNRLLAKSRRESN